MTAPTPTAGQIEAPSGYGRMDINKFSCVYFCMFACFPPGTEILTVQAADNDDPKTDNVRIFYRLVGQIPESPRALFRVDPDSGVIFVQADSMEGTAPQYTLTITAEDAKGDFCSQTNLSFCEKLFFVFIIINILSSYCKEHLSCHCIEGSCQDTGTVNGTHG